jgi:hypothetical protein
MAVRFVSSFLKRVPRLGLMSKYDKGERGSNFPQNSRDIIYGNITEVSSVHPSSSTAMSKILTAMNNGSSLIPCDVAISKYQSHINESLAMYIVQVTKYILSPQGSMGKLHDQNIRRTRLPVGSHCKICIMP